MTLNELKRAVAADPQLVPLVEVHSVDLALYVAYCRHGERMTPVTSGARALRFKSRYAAFKALKGVGLTEVEFVHRCAYDEMIGMPSADNGAEMRETINLQHIRTE